MIATVTSGVVCLVVVAVLPFGSWVGAEPPRGNCVALEVSSSTEKDGLMAEFADHYNKANRTFGGRCATVQVHGVTSGDAMQELTVGWDPDRIRAPAPQVWMPTSSLWLGQLKQKGKGDLVQGEHPSITASALVVAMPESRAAALGPDREQLGWKDILGVATDPRGWGSRNRPEWGPFVLGRDNPHSSSSGLAATIASYYAATLKATGKSGVTKTDLDNTEVIRFVHGVESSVADENYGDDSTLFMKRLFEAPQPFISAIAVQEQMVYLYNHGAPTGDLNDLGKRAPTERLVAVHPSDGTVKLDHPYVVLSTANKDQRDAAADFRDFLLESAQQKRFAELGFRDREHPEQPIRQLADVGIREGRTASFIPEPEPEVVTKMVEGWDAAHRKARVLLVLDISGSMNQLADKEAKTGPLAGKTKLDLLKPAAKRGLELLSTGDEIELWTFSDKHEQKVSRKPIRDARTELTNAIDGLTPATSTALYRTTVAAKETMTQNLDSTKINAVVIMTDGKNEDPGHSEDLNFVLKAVGGESPPIRIYTIAYGADAAAGELTEIAKATKGKSYDASDPATVDMAFADVFRNF